MTLPFDSDLAAALTATSAEGLYAALEKQTLPIVVDDAVTFVYFGEAERVSLRHWIYGLPSSIEMDRIHGTDIWYRLMRFPDGSRIEYKFGITRGGHEQWIHDPRNPNIARDPFGGNSVVHVVGYEVPDWIFVDREVPQGTFEELLIDSQAFGNPRHIRVYLPAKLRSYRRYRLLVVHDGDDYLRYSSLGIVLDNLIGRLEIPPLIVALSNPQDRLVEYANDLRHARFLAEELVPELQSRYPLIQESSGRGLMGASFGAVASLSAAWHYPGTFDALLLQSGSFAFTDIGRHQRSKEFDPVVEFMNQFRAQPGLPSKRAFVSCGRYESLIYENRSLVPLLQSHGMQVKYVEARDGHNWENWRDRLRDALTWLYPGPLWVTYL